MGLLDGVTIESVAMLAAVMLVWTVISTYIIWRWIVPHFFGPYVHATIVNMLAHPTKDTQHAVNGLVSMIFQVKVKTGKSLKDEDGAETDEEIPLMTYFGRYLSDFMLMKLKAAKGGAMANAREGIKSELGDGSDLLGVLGPRRGQSSVQWVIEQAAPQILQNPKIMEMLTERVADMLSKR
jgi:hypothetical protein